MLVKLPLKWMPAKAFGGLFKSPNPTCVVVHCTESENTSAMAEALAGPGWFGGAKAGTSSHKIVDLDSIVEGVKRAMVAYHAGPGGNTVGVAYEFCGRASWSAEKWREPAQLQMLRNAAPHIADDLRSMDAPARWLSLAQLAAHSRGLCTHNDVRLALGGTTHSDPGPNFPYAELLAYVQAELDGTSTTTDSTTSGAAGAVGSLDQEDDDMDNVLIIGVKDDDPAWDGYWAVNLVSFRAAHLYPAQLALYAGVPAGRRHEGQGKDILGRFEHVAVTT